jgi:glycosyltransferase involved in cell wall biosynthesis
MPEPAAGREVGGGQGRTGVLYLAPWIDLGGSDKGTIDWFAHIDRERWAPSLICTQPSPNRWLPNVVPYADEVWVLPDLMAGREFPDFILGFIVSRRIRVVHIMHSRLGLDLMPDISALPNPPAIVVQMHVEEPNRGGYVPYAADRFGQVVDAFSVSSEHLAVAMEGYDVPRRKLHVIPTGVDAETEWSPERHRPLELEGTGHHVLWPGRLTHQKDPETAVDAVAAVTERGVDMALHMVGDGELEGLVRTRAAELGVSDRVRIHPPSRELGRWYRSCELTFMTSRYEGIPYVVFESLAMGRPVVAPALPGNVEFFDDDSGLMVPPDSPGTAYADALVALLSDDDRRAAMGAASRKRMLRDFSCRQMAQSHGELYDGLIATRPPLSEPAVTELPPPMRLPRAVATEPTVTVIVTCYELGHYLRGAMRSIREQTHPAAQVILVDDASRGAETIEALREIEDDPGVELIRLEENLGPSGARNIALERATGNYVLPLDADDELLPDALRSMLAQVEAASENIAFVYPNQQHIGTRRDYVPVPAYNLVLLRDANYCHTSSLFDRRVFDAGFRYGEERAGHEDWNLVLALAEHGLYGVPADERTLLYRKRGFSRLATRFLESETPEAVAERLFPALYDRANRIKPRWAPALSVILRGRDWPAGLLAAQSTPDFEVLAPEGVAVDPDPEAHVVPGDPDDPRWLVDAVARARGRWVLVADPAAAPALGRRELAELVLRVFWFSGTLGALVLADGVPPTFPFDQLPPPLPASARPVAVAWERIPDEAGETAVLAPAGDPLADLVLTLQSTRKVQWRTIA